MNSHPIVRSAFFVGSALAFGLSVAFLSWWHLPYESLDRFTPEQRFFVWEGVVWLCALLLTFLGSSIILENLGWRVAPAVRELWLSLTRRTRDSLLSPRIVPWWMLLAGVVLMSIGTLARLTIAP